MLLLHRCTLSKFHVTDDQNMHDQIMRVEGPEAHDQIAFGVFHSFLVEVQMNAGYSVHTCDACEITTWR